MVTDRSGRETTLRSGAPARADGRGDFTDPDVAQRVELALREMSAALVRFERMASQALLR